MAEIKNDINVISKRNSGFPSYLDFDTLRTEGITHLGNLAGKIWTDHNVHDPGITMLEMLCYALLDLGYRTNLPAKDLFTRDPNDKTPDTNFITPSDILTCNPLTITDFRKLLIDIDGVRNAWLTVATPKDEDVSDQLDPERFCNPDRTNEDSDCVSYLNGLYRVYVDLERNIDTAFSTPEAKNEYIQNILKKIRQALMAHRNICEDFIDITILCKWEIGVCAQVELEPQADAEAVYLALMENLKNFFSPAPRFYTLDQLLEKKKTIDNIFAGRPRNVSESYGFVDTDEFEALTLRKEIHVSDVYNILFGVKGVAKVSRLRLRNCANQTLEGDKWVVNIPQHHVPDFSPRCTGIEFSRNGMPVNFDFDKYATVLQLNREHTGKVPYQSTSPVLDNVIPRGEFLNGISTWSSIQNDFPRVYGIEKGALPQDASPLRVAQARQLQGYLLFFDQLLANYLSQMSHVRTLYSLSPANKDEYRRTYFTNTIDDAPNNEVLARFGAQMDAATREGSTLATLAGKHDLLLLGSQVKEVELERNRKGTKLAPFTFATKAERDVAAWQWRDDFSTQGYTINIITRGDQCVFYYITGSSQETALVSARYYRNEQEARQAATWLAYVSQTPECVHTYTVAGENRFSFDLVLRQQDFGRQLQIIAEDRESYVVRRKGFQQHLLSRFAETFADYALLSFGMYDERELQRREIAATETFLAHYGDISSNRGRAFDYTRNGWPGDNISGFEKRFMALTGAPALRRQSLCNFEVVKYPEKFVLQLRLEEDPFFKTEEKFESPQVAKDAVRKILKAAGQSGSYFVRDLPQEETFEVYLNYDEKKNVVFSRAYASKADAGAVSQQMHYLFSATALPGEPLVATYSYSAFLKNNDGVAVKKLLHTFGSEPEAQAAAVKQIGKIGNPAVWGDIAQPSHPPKRLIFDMHAAKPRFLDLERFRVDLDDTTIGKPGIITYELLDREHHRFKFCTVSEFQNTKEANDDVRRLLVLMMSPGHYVVKPDKESGRWAVFVADGETDVACSFFSGEREALRMKEEIYDIVQQFTYDVTIESVPATWTFQYALGYEPGMLYTLESARAYPSQEEAAAALRLFGEKLTSALLVETGDGLSFKLDKSATSPAAVLRYEPGQEKPTRQSVDRLLALKRKIEGINKALEGQDDKILDRFVSLDEESLCPYGYRLVDKDGLHAVHQIAATDESKMQPLLKTLMQRGSDGYNFPELCTQGDVTRCRLADDGKTKWYHYQLKTLNAINSPRGERARKLVLFESVRGYTNKAEADKAFAENYHTILLLALEAENYGARKPISETPVVVRTIDSLTRQDSVVFIPATTLDFLGTYAGQAVRELIRVVKSYPIKSIRKKLDCVDFSRRFLPCETTACLPVDDVCGSDSEKPVYFFVLYDRVTETEDWQSASYYENPADAYNAFRFFLFLLRYEGNFTIQCDCTGHYRLYLREVLAESIHRFASEAAAWGKDGVQRFIKVSQRRKSFYGYTAQCCHRFFVACENIRIIHPVQYDTPQLRDETLIRLYQHIKNVASWTFAGFCSPRNTVVLDFSGNALAEMHGDPLTQSNEYLDEYIAITEAILRYGLCVEEDRVTLAHRKTHWFAPAPAFPGGLEDLKEALLTLAFFQPFTRQQNQPAAVRFGIEVRLPGFNRFDACNPGDTGDAAWTSGCTYATCQEAIAAFQQMKEVLSHFENYKAVFECVCGPYGIVIQPLHRGCVSVRGQEVGAANDILAQSPQCYDSPEELCDAIERAKALINREGLHLAEHILLRPLKEEDCACRMLPGTNDFDVCKFPPWEVDNADPCLKDFSICFQPGHDPYSFIATVALPVWTERFRKPENRERVESLLRREAPAHVLLRVLWLTPHDLCLYETLLKRWQTWMAYKKTCGPFDMCALIDFLTRRTWECFDNTEPCDLCEDVARPYSCVDVIREEEKNRKRDRQSCEQTWFEQVNELFGWQKYECSPPSPQRAMEIVKAQSRETPKKAVIEAPEKVKPSPKKKTDALKETAVKPVEKTELAPPLATPAADVPVEMASKAKFVNARLKGYRDGIAAIQAALPKNELVAKINAFTKAAHPLAADWVTLLTLLEKDLKASARKKTLAREQVVDLLEYLIHFFLDKISFNGKDLKELQSAKSILNALRKAKINLSKIFHQWQAPVVKQYEPDLDVNAIDKLFNPE